MFQQRLARPLLGDFGGVFQNRFEMSVLPHQFRCGLVANPAHAGNVVRRITNQRQIIGNELRRNTKPVFCVLCTYPMLLDVRVAATSRIEKPYTRTDKLLKILIA